MFATSSALGECLRRAGLHSHARETTRRLVRLCTHKHVVHPRLSQTYRFNRVQSIGNMTSSSTGVRLTVDKPECLMDEDIVVKVMGLSPSDKVIVLVTTEVEGNHFWSHGLFRSNDRGIVDLSTDTPINGSYNGIDPAGLLWSMVAVPWLPAHHRMFQRRAIEPRTITFSVFPESDSPGDYLKDRTKVLASVEHKRMFKSQNTRRIPIKHPRIQGTLFLPEGPGLFPGIIDMYGGLVDIVEGRAALLASHGFVTLSLSYAHGNGLPQSMLDIELSYIEIRAIVYMSGLPFTLPGWTYHGQNIGSNTRIDETRLQMKQEGMSVKHTFVVPDDSYLKPWTHGAHLLTILGDDDLLTGVEHNIRFYEKIMPQDYRHEKAELVIYPGAGHIIEPPNTPLCRVVYGADQVQLEMRIKRPLYQHNNLILSGGYPKEHAAAQRDAWPRAINFLRKHLR
ncbi:Acyl-coenzyme A thioesterase 3 [Mizuhopecten yessoensis]|uniref:Acyl-coenzyme A thioesterase 3 n=1 Tax=Mizuhopecten yessoensis TaxID=6573 RepID=A0A210PIT1_MIZYE|nr:Acyl-coenzyme A thioesterase 3 [Mizuhopecten yessoensis]